MNKIGFFPYTPATQMLHGLADGIDMLHEEGLDNVFARHERLAEATRRAVKRLGPRDHVQRSEVLFADDHRGDDAGRPRRRRVPQRWRWRHFNISYGASFGQLRRQVFRIGHLGDINDGTLIGALGSDRNGAVACRRSAQEGRRAGCDGLFDLGAARRRQGRRRSKSRFL